MRWQRIFLIVLDSFGIGELPDAAAYGDKGSNTLRAIRQSPYFHCPNLARLGLFHIDGVTSVGEPVQDPIGVYARMAEQSAGKDTTTGHWEMASLVSNVPFPTYPNGFPAAVLQRFSEKTGRGVLCNRPYSGTQVIQVYGAEHCQTGKLIVYTSADSVFQIAAHESVVSIEELYRYCGIAREILSGPHAVGRVIARPFTGTAPDFVRTANRRDFSLTPPRETLLNLLKRQGLDVIAVGKIKDIFNGSGITQPYLTHSNREGMRTISELMQKRFHGLCFINLVDFDMLYGHRNDVDGYAKAMSDFDQWLGETLPHLSDTDLLLITADHGCDPSTPSTDHSREYTPLLLYSPGLSGKNLGTRSSFADIGKTIGQFFCVNTDQLDGKSFLGELNDRTSVD